MDSNLRQPLPLGCRVENGVRLAKRVAELRVCSRREAEQIISGGWVRVDGNVIEEPQFRVNDQQHIEIEAKANPALTEPVTLLLHKPPGYHTIQAGHQADSELPAIQLLSIANGWTEERYPLALNPKQPLKMHFTRLTTCAPLETIASGLVVFSQDWRIIRKLTENASSVEHEVIVEVEGDLATSKTPIGLKQLNKGISFNGSTPSAIKISWQNETHLRVALKGAQIGQIVKQCAAAGLTILTMKRIRLGCVSMGKLPLGQWRYLRDTEKF